jgi:hypothetical protein
MSGSESSRSNPSCDSGAEALCASLVAKSLHQGDRAYMIANETILELF